MIFIFLQAQSIYIYDSQYIIYQDRRKTNKMSDNNDNDIYDQEQSPNYVKIQHQHIKKHSGNQIAPEVKNKLNKEFQFNSQNLDDMIELRNKKSQKGGIDRISKNYLLNNNNAKPSISRRHRFKGSSHTNQYKVRVQSRDTTSCRYECFCERRYLSYCALYQHLKLKHPSFLKVNNKFSSTHMTYTSDPDFGYKIKKLVRKQYVSPEHSIIEQKQVRRGRKEAKVVYKQKVPLKLVNQFKEVIRFQKQSFKRRMELLMKERKATEQIIEDYQKMIKHYENIFQVLSIPAFDRIVKREA